MGLGEMKGKQRTKQSTVLQKAALRLPLSNGDCKRSMRRHHGMGTKHDILTEEELSVFYINSRVIAQLETILSHCPSRTPEQINVLDWGCGRGRSVAKLREKGFNAFGVEIDQKAMLKGFSLFEQRGLVPGELMKPVSKVGDFDDGFFDLIFSEQVFEHIADLSGVIAEQARITAPGGIGIHLFPGAKNVWEGHLLMPFAHWLPKSLFRKYWIAAMLLLSWGPPKDAWPETIGKSFMEQVNVYYHYLNEKTYYRDSKHICDEFGKCGFDAKYEVSGYNSRILRMIPVDLRKKGFPRGSVTVVVRRNERIKD